MPYIVYSQEDGKIGVVTPLEEANIKILVERCVPSGRPYFITDSLDLDNDYFDAYIYQDDKAVFDIERAKNILRESFREARIPLFEKLDLEYMRAHESGNETLIAEVVAKKQALRDITNLDLPDTLEGLKKFWPEILTS